jgi:hypothetical protein
MLEGLKEKIKNNKVVAIIITVLVSIATVATALVTFLQSITEG